MEQPNYFSILTADVRYDKSLKPQAKLLCAEISSLCSARGYCTASNQYFATLYDLNVLTISRLISQLVDRGYITIVVNRGDGNSRKMYLNSRSAIDKIVNSTDEKVNTPIDKKVNTPIDKKVNIIIQDNNKTRINKDMSEASASDVPSVLSKRFNEVKIEELDEERQKVLGIAVAFQELYIKNLKAENIPATTQERSTLKNVIEPIRLMVAVDNFTISDLRDLYKFVDQNKFWRSNVRSNSKLREKAQTLLSQFRNDQKSHGGDKPLTMAEMLAMATK